MGCHRSGQTKDCRHRPPHEVSYKRQVSRPAGVSSSDWQAPDEFGLESDNHGDHDQDSAETADSDWVSHRAGHVDAELLERQALVQVSRRWQSLTSCSPVLATWSTPSHGP